MSGTKLLLAVALAIPATLFATDANADGTSTSVTFVGCPGFVYGYRPNTGR